MPMAYWPPVRSKPPIIQQEFKGINKLDPFSIGNAFASETVNLTNTKYPAITTRPGFSLVGTLSTRIIGMGVYKESELHVIANDGTWWRLNADNTWIIFKTGLNTTEPWTFTNFKGNLSNISLIASNGSTPYYYDGLTVQPLTGVPSGAKYITQFADRLFAAVGNTLYYSAYRMANDWTTVNLDDADSGNIVIESPDGEAINSIQGGLTRLTITKPSSVHALFGYAPSDYSVRTVTLDTGQFNQKSGITLDGWLYQLFDTGLYRFPGSGFPVNDFSERIKSYFNSLSASSKNDAVLGSDGNKLYASVAGTAIEYDPKRDTYFPWSGISALHFAQVQGNTYIGDASGRVLKLGGATNDAGTGISWKWVSRPYTGDSLAQFIRWFRLWATVDLPTGSTFSVYLSKSATGDSDWVQAGTTITGTGNMERKTIYFPSNIVPNAQLIRVKFEGSGPMTMYEYAFEQEQYVLR